VINVTFESEHLHGTCVSLASAEQAYGSMAAGALVAFLEDARALERADELLALLGDDVKVLEDDSLSVAFGSDYRARLVVVGERYDRDPAGRVEWASVTRLKLQEISRVP
jgi:hypothetical protein